MHDCAKVHGFVVSRFFEIIQPFAGSEEMGKEVSLQKKKIEGNILIFFPVISVHIPLNLGL